MILAHYAVRCFAKDNNGMPSQVNGGQKSYVFEEMITEDVARNQHGDLLLDYMEEIIGAEADGPKIVGKTFVGGNVTLF
jgi:hypothetical protein